MNERIRELALQAGYKPLPGFDFANSLEELFMEKFAELLVKECVLEAMDAQHHNTSIRLQLYKHFGVE